MTCAACVDEISELCPELHFSIGTCWTRNAVLWKLRAELVMKKAWGSFGFPLDRQHAPTGPEQAKIHACSMASHSVKKKNRRQETASNLTQALHKR